jgi:tRNA A-37 threonylcarbamoyl transferase component Bud32/tetratricopeptide (TPR) repeat protein
MIGQTISHYEIIEKLGEGGMGIVYKARDTKLERFAALKVLPADRVADVERTRRFVQEAKAASAPNHPNIITIYEIERTPDGSDFIAMELIEGDTLRALAGQPLAPHSVSKIGRQVVEALSVAHAGGIVHRDIKPENIMLRRDGYVKILDFGLARLHGSEIAGTETQVTRVTRPGLIFGTLAYMSPEQARGERVTGASDVFSLGLVLYELAAGRHAYPASSQLVILQAILSEQPLPPSRLQPEIPAALEDVILRMLQKDPIQRPNAKEVAEALADLEGRISGVFHVRPVSVARRQTVGHEKERAELHSCFESSCAGRGMLACVSGEPGIGKTTFVEDFLAEAANFEPCVGKGRCSERLAGTEAYLPILEALEGLLHGTMGSQLARVMKLMAPTWYVQVASQLALLFEAAREASRAVDYFVVAAQHASQISAHREAVELARRGLRLLATLPDTPERARQELRLQLGLATPLMSLKGYAAPEVEEAYSRAYALCSDSANDVETYQALMGLGAFYFFRPQIGIGLEILDKMLPLAEASQNNVLLSLAHFAAASVLSHSGDLVQALEHIASCFSVYDPQKHSLYVLLAGLNPGLIGRSQWGRLLWLSGCPDQGKLRAAEALAEARKLGHAFSLCFALIFSAWVLEYCGDAKKCMDAAGEAVKIATEQGYTMHRAWAGTLHGWALSEMGCLDEGIAQIEESLEGMRLLGTELIRPEFLSLLAAAVAKRGDV